jgi:hypothetical protein
MYLPIRGRASFRSYACSGARCRLIDPPARRQASSFDVSHPLFSVDDRNYLTFGNAELDGTAKEVGVVTDAQHLKLREQPKQIVAR